MNGHDGRVAVDQDLKARRVLVSKAVGAGGRVLLERGVLVIVCRCCYVAEKPPDGPRPKIRITVGDVRVQALLTAWAEHCATPEHQAAWSRMPTQVRTA